MKVMRIFFLADTHGSGEFWKSCFEICKPVMEQVDVIVHLGDGIETTVEELKSFPKVILVKGSHDRLQSGIEKEHLEIIKGKKLVFLHGDRTDRLKEQLNIWRNKFCWRFFGSQPDLKDFYDQLYQRFRNKYDLVAYGHVHIPKIEKREGTIFFCPGAASEDVPFGGFGSVGMVEISDVGGEAKICCKIFKLNIKKRKLGLQTRKVFYGS